VPGGDLDGGRGEQPVLPGTGRAARRRRRLGGMAAPGEGPGGASRCARCGPAGSQAAASSAVSWAPSNGRACRSALASSRAASAVAVLRRQMARPEPD
jgi:hypothetical protein